MLKKEDWVAIQDWQNEHKALLNIVADPYSDSISISYGGLNAFMKFPAGPMDKGVIFNALLKSNFEQAIRPLIAGIATTCKMDGNDVPTANLLRSIGGAVKSFGEEREITKNNLMKKHVKTNRGKK